MELSNTDIKTMIDARDAAVKGKLCEAIRDGEFNRVITLVSMLAPIKAPMIRSAFAFQRRSVSVCGEIGRPCERIHRSEPI